MHVEIKLDNDYKEPKVLILTSEITEEVNGIVKKLTQPYFQVITGFKDNIAEVIDTNDIFRLYSSNQRVFVVTDRGEYIVRLRLYELEERLNKEFFVRISNSEIINLRRVNNFDLSLNGTICVKLKNGEVAYVSRRYVSRIKKVLGLWSERLNVQP